MQTRIHSFPAALGIALLVLFLGHPSKGQIIGSGKCPVLNVPFRSYRPFSYFPWYEILRYPSVMESDLQCVTFRYQDNYLMRDQEHYLTITGTKPETGRKITITGLITLANSTSNDYSNYILRYPGDVPELWYAPNPFPSNLQVLADTSYNYLVLWSCKNYDRYHLKYMWVVSTLRSPPQSSIDEALTVLDRFNLPKTGFERTPQTYC